MLKTISFAIILLLTSSSLAQVPNASWSAESIEFNVSRYHPDTIVKALIVAEQWGVVTIDDVWIEGDEGFKVETSLPLQLMPSQTSELSIRYAPLDTNTHVALAIFSVAGGGRDTLRLTAKASRTTEGVYWDQSVLRFTTTECSTPTTATVELNSDVWMEATIDSVRIGGRDASNFRIISSTPAGRLRDFVLTPAPPGSSIQYLIQFDPNSRTQSSEAYLLAHSSSGTLDTLLLLGNVLTPNVESVDTTINGLATGVDHVIRIMTGNVGEGTFRVGSFLFTGDLDAVIEGLDFGDQIIPAMPADFSITIRSDEPGTKSRRFVIRGNCDDRFEVMVTATFIGPSTVDGLEHAIACIRQEGNTLILQHNEASPLRYLVLDVTGRDVLSGQADKLTGLDLSELLSGVYVVSLDHPAGTKSLKFMKW